MIATRRNHRSRLHDLVADRLVEAREPPDEMFSRHTLAAQFDDKGVPVTLDSDSANVIAEECSMAVTYKTQR